MKTTIRSLCHNIDSIINYLAPYLPLVNCHMVEFLTNDHWNTYLPNNLKEYLDQLDLNESLEQFWNATNSYKGNEPTELRKWITEARKHYLEVNNDYCLSVEQLNERIKSWGGELQPEIKVKEFMNNKKSYEVQTMARAVSSVYSAASGTCCVEAGGGRGHLLTTLALGYHIPSLTVDCDPKTLSAAINRIKVIQKQWHAIAKRIHDGAEEKPPHFNKDLQRFAQAFITKDTDLGGVVREMFPECKDLDTRIILTGLHTCGNLGPDSLRIFTTRSHIAGLLTVPCCYHLLTEDSDVELFDVFQKEYGSGERTQGFPMSEYLRGYRLGRNARMLAAQSVDRVLHQRRPPAQSLLHRAMLQVVIKRYLPNTTLKEGKLKRISKCDTFEQYLKMADKILNLNLNLPETFYTDTQLYLDCQWKKMTLFYLIRLCLAQVVESVILLDRILFLYENGFDKVYLVKLFDPVLSPRCHSIVALR